MYHLVTNSIIADESEVRDPEETVKEGYFVHTLYGFKTLFYMY